MSFLSKMELKHTTVCISQYIAKFPIAWLVYMFFYMNSNEDKLCLDRTCLPSVQGYCNIGLTNSFMHASCQ